MKWVKRLVLLVVFLGVMVGVIAAAGWWMSRRVPDWYARRHATPQETAAAAHRAEREVQRTVSWAQDQQAFTDSSQHGAPSTQPAKTLQISLTEDELNGFFQKWDVAFGWSRNYSQYLSDPQIVLHEGRLILAATAKDMGSVVSIVFAPKLDDGKLEMPVEQVLAGRLPLPQSFWDHYRATLTQRMASPLPKWQRGAEIRPNGTANSDTVAAAMSELLIDILNDHPTPPVLFLPYDVSNNHRSLPVKLIDVKIANKTLTLEVQPLTSAERTELLTTLRAPRVEPAPMPAPVGNVVAEQ
jgi:hypothetical protein